MEVVVRELIGFIEYLQQHRHGSIQTAQNFKKLVNSPTQLYFKLV